MSDRWAICTCILTLLLFGAVVTEQLFGWLSALGW